MSKVKKVFAIILSMAMILGMSLTTFAAPEETGASATNGKITVKGLTSDETTTVKLYQIISWNSEESKWEKADWVKEDDVTFNQQDNKIDIKWSNIQTYATDDDLYVKEGLTNPATVYNNDTAVFDNLGIGAWMIVAVGDDGKGSGTEYTVMGTYTYGYDDDNLMVPIDVTVNAKGEDYKVTKTFAEGSEEFVAIGDEVEFEIKTTFPSYGVDTVDKTFSITDSPEGLKTTEVVVKVGNDTLTMGQDYTLTETLPTEKEFTINFDSDYISANENTHAGAPVTVTVTATVVGVDGKTTYSNKADTNKSENPSEPEIGDTGSIEITKKNTDMEILKGAEFKISEVDDQTALDFVKESDGVYRLALQDDSDKTSTLVATNGTLLIKGLGAGTYEITETKAPNGYNTVDIANKTIVANVETNDSGNKLDNVSHIEFDVVDSKLASLPSTGGIGTTIFTIGGCVIMIAAAGLYFASRRKENK